MKIKKVIVLGLAFLGLASITSCKKVEVDNNQNQQGGGNVSTDKCTISFDSNGGSALNDLIVDKNTKANKPADPTRDGFEFVCWTLNGVEFNFDTNVQQSIKLVAKWKALEATSQYGFGEELTSWEELEDVAGTAEKDGKTVLAGEAKMFDITFASNGKNRVDKTDTGSSYNTQKAAITIELKSKGKIIVEGTWGSTTAAGKVYLKKDSTAVYTSNDITASIENPIDFETTELDAGTYTLTSDASIRISKLVIERTIEYCTVTYVSEKGYTPVETILEKGDFLGRLPSMSAEGFVFEGWYTESTFENLFEDTTKLTTNITLYAKWKTYNPEDYVTIDYVIAPSTQLVENSIIDKNTTLKELPILNNLAGYRFDGWYMDDTFETPFTSSTLITGDITLFAKFVKQITVTYVYEDTTEIATQAADAGKAISYYPSVKTIFGKKFVGWKLNNTLFDKSTTVNADITLVAAYEDVDTSASVAVLSSNGYEEGLYAEFMEYEGAESYNAYVKASNGTYTKLDNQLIRKYKEANSTNTYMRVDAVGLKAGSYSLKIVPIIGGAEYEAIGAEVTDLSVIAHDRSGFGFVNGSSSGAYNDDGTLKANARVIYVSNSNKDTVETSAIESKATVTVKGIQNIITAMKSQKGISDPVCIRLLGNITDPSVLNKGDLYVDAVKNLTIEGIGTDATANGFGIVIKNSSCVEIRNIGFMNCNSNEGDDCGLQQKNDHIWVHNCDFFYGDAGSDADQAKGDGALDTKTSKYITHSYNHFFDNGKCNLQGMKGETPENYITYHHNWYDHSDSRHPRVRTCSVHIYNNYFDGNAKYGIASAMGASIFAENNYFRSTTNTIPFMSGQMAHDIKDDGTNVLSKEAGGVIKEFGNVFEGSNFRYAEYQTNNTSFDAYKASSRSEVIPASVKAPGGIYNNFDTNSSIMYTYTVQSAEDAKNTVIAHAGRVQGGDFKWVFTEADDASDKVNTALKAALTAYSSNLLSVQGIEAGSGSTTPQTPDTPSTDNPADTVVALINALPEASTITAANVTSVNAAKTAYDALSVEDKAKVTNYSKLESCLAAVASLPQSTQILTFNTGKTGDNSFFTVSGNLKSGVAEKTYNGTKYTTALKMESATTIKFTTTATTTITIITDTASKKIKINGTNCSTNSDGVYVLSGAEAKEYTVSKGDSINVYSIIVE